MSVTNINCERCDASFSSSKALKIHVTKIHAPQKNFECSLCFKKFSREYNLKRHMLTCIVNNRHTTQIKNELIAKEFECQYQKKVADLLQQQLDTVKETVKIPTTINNITNNNINMVITITSILKILYACRYQIKCLMP